MYYTYNYTAQKWLPRQLLSAQNLIDEQNYIRSLTADSLNLHAVHNGQLYWPNGETRGSQVHLVQKTSGALIVVERYALIIEGFIAIGQREIPSQALNYELDGKYLVNLTLDLVQRSQMKTTHLNNTVMPTLSSLPQLCVNICPEKQHKPTVGLPIVRLIRKDGKWIKDESYYPPVLHIGAHKDLWNWANLIRNCLAQIYRDNITVFRQLRNNRPLFDLKRFCEGLGEYLAGHIQTIMNLREETSPKQIIEMIKGMAQGIDFYIKTAENPGKLLTLFQEHTALPDQLQKPDYEILVREVIEMTPESPSFEEADTIRKLIQGLASAFTDMAITGHFRSQGNQNPLITY